MSFDRNSINFNLIFLITFLNLLHSLADASSSSETGGSNQNRNNKIKDSVSDSNSKTLHPFDFNYLQLLTRMPKLISFDPIDDDMRVSLDFVVPVASVPSKRFLDPIQFAQSKGIVNINTAALMLGAGFVGGGALVGSIFSTIGRAIMAAQKASSSSVSKNPYYGSGQNYEGSNSLINDKIKFTYKDSKGVRQETALLDIIDNVDGFLQAQNIDVNTCLSKTVCVMVKTSVRKVDNGNADSTSKLVEGLTSSKWLLSLMKGTAIRDAIESGRNDLGCGYKYIECPLSERQINEFFVKHLRM